MTITSAPIWDTIWDGLTKSDAAKEPSDALRSRVLAAAGAKPPATDIAVSAWNQLLTWVVDDAAKAADERVFVDAENAAKEAKKAKEAAIEASKHGGAGATQVKQYLALAVAAANYAVEKAAEAKVASTKAHASTLLCRQPEPLGYPANTSSGIAALPLKRLYIGDLMWLYFYERMGVFRMLRRLIDDYSRYGRFPTEFKTAEELENLTRLSQSGEASSAGERAAVYLRSFGWSCEGLQVPAGVQANLSFDSNWRSFLRNALSYYRGKNISQLFNKSAGPSGTSVVAACDAARSLWESFKPFETSSNYPATYYGLAWTVGTLRLIELKDIKNALGVSDSTAGPAAISAAYEVLVLGQPPRGMDSSRYMVHNDCARYGRRILLDLQGLKNSQNYLDNTELKSWLEDAVTESNIEGFGSAWLRLTGEDLSPTVQMSVSR